MKIKLTLLIIVLLAGPAVMYGQGHAKRDGNSYYRFEFQKSSQDSIPSLYCVITLNPLGNYQKINLSYDGQQETYQINDIQNGKIENATLHNKKLYVLITEHLKVPFVMVTATANNGQQYNIWLKDGWGKFIDPVQGKAKWKRAMTRLHQLDKGSSSGKNH